MNNLNLLSNIPISSAVLKSYLDNLKYPKNKISDMEKNGELIRLKRDLYVYSKSDISKELIANHLYGISYVSLETALAYFGMIPERVYAIRSITTRRSKTFVNPLGNFEFKTVSVDYFRIGLQQEIVEDKFAFLIASPTKAICDMIITTSNLRLQSVKAMYSYLIENLRIDYEVLKKIDKDIVRQCIDVSKKKTELKCLLKIIL